MLRNAANKAVAANQMFAKRMQRDALLRDEIPRVRSRHPGHYHKNKLYERHRHHHERLRSERDRRQSWISGTREKRKRSLLTGVAGLG